MNQTTTHTLIVPQGTPSASRRSILRAIATLGGLMSLGVLEPSASVVAGPSADCKFHCKKKARRKARRRCYDRCNSALGRCQANAACVAEQVCGDARCMTLCEPDTDCQPGRRCQDGACIAA